MARMRWMFLALLVSGCDTETDTEETENPEDFLAYGDLLADDGLEAQVRTRKAFGMATNGQGAVYLATNDQGTCKQLADYLDPDRNSPFDPSPFFTGSDCNISFTFDYPEDEGWDGQQFSEADALNGIWSLKCAMGEGTFNLETRRGFKDYYWSGPWWGGHPTAYTATVHGNQDDTALGIDFEMEEYEGNYDDMMSKTYAQGEVHTMQTIETIWCPDLVHTSLFTF